ncbi:very short patch repair endonuclease [Halomonas sp. B23F22_10]|uniref:very short patch repair endonuclease n=1 Tax=Halomonas sp. B23F22_10 TaxID=3459515 RepID=UPI00373E723A
MPGDVLTPEQRAYCMSRIRGRDTSPELKVRRYLHSRGFRFRLKRKDLPCRPDLVMPKFDLVIFVHGCFWHRHEGCGYATTPSTRQEFWSDKFARNAERDQRQYRQLREAGWRVLVIWECGLKKIPERIEEIVPLIQESEMFQEWPGTPPRPTDL